MDSVAAVWEIFLWYSIFIAISHVLVSLYYCYAIGCLGTEEIPLYHLQRPHLFPQDVILGLYGLALLLALTFSTSFWPREIDKLHTRVYCAISLTGAVGSFVLVSSAASVKLLMLGLTQPIPGLYSLPDLFIGEAAVHKVNSLAGGTWIWLSLIAILFLVGLSRLWLSFKTSSPG